MSSGFSYLIIPSEESVSLWMQKSERVKSVFLLSADNNSEGWGEVLSKIREHEERGFHFTQPE